MNSSYVNSFLKSMESSCESYSQEAEAQRQILRQVDARFHQLEKNIHDTFVNHSSSNTIKAKKASESNIRRQRPLTTPKKYRSITKTKNLNNTNLVIRPAPFPVKNYILPAQDLVGPKRFYQSPVHKQRKVEEIEDEEERRKYPWGYERPSSKKSQLNFANDLLITNHNMMISRARSQLTKKRSEIIND